MQQLAVNVLGATGTVGRASLEVCQQAGWQILAICANKDIDGLLELCKRYKPQFAALNDENLHETLVRKLQGSGIHAAAGSQAILQAAATPSDATIAAISGIDGLLPTITAAKASKKLVLANKECIVAGGAYFMQHCAENNCPIIPADSEHNAVFQILEQQKRESLDKTILDKTILDKIILTASGGPFLDTRLDELVNVTPEQACAHPNFRMGAKIAVDSATMMNKALEVIEAAWLFDLDEQRIDVAIHPQQAIHGMVALRDGSLFAHLGACDMRAPLWHALHWPQRVAIPEKAPQRFDWREIAQLSFREVDEDRFPALRLARESLKSSLAPIILNAANEVVVKAFLQREITFDRIVPILQEVMQAHSKEKLDAIQTQKGNSNLADNLGSNLDNSLERILTIDAYGRRLAQKYLLKKARSVQVTTIKTRQRENITPLANNHSNP